MNLAYLKQGRSYKLRLHEGGIAAWWSFLKHDLELFCLNYMLSMIYYSQFQIQSFWTLCASIVPLLKNSVYMISFFAIQFLYSSCFVTTVWLWPRFIHISQSFCCESLRNIMLVFTWRKLISLQLFCVLDLVYVTPAHYDKNKSLT